MFVASIVAFIVLSIASVDILYPFVVVLRFEIGEFVFTVVCTSVLLSDIVDVFSGGNSGSVGVRLVAVR